jgi:hypothetical protein
MIGLVNLDRQSVGQSVLVSGAHLGPVTNFSFSLKFLLDIYGFDKWTGLKITVQLLLGLARAVTLNYHVLSFDTTRTAQKTARTTMLLFFCLYSLP